jgi:hypothetical protein
MKESIRPSPNSSPGHLDREAAQQNGSFVLPAVKRVAVNRLQLYAGTLTFLCVLPANREKNESRRADSNR